MERDQQRLAQIHEEADRRGFYARDDFEEMEQIRHRLHECDESCPYGN